MEKINTVLINEVLHKLNIFLKESIKPEVDNISINDNFSFLFLKETLRPVNFDYVNLDELIGIEYQKNALLKNTEKFINNKPANNALLWGERGTGKSSLIKAVVGKFKCKNLKIIQVLKEDILSVLNLYEIIAKYKDYKFIIFIDDLSFEPTEKEYKEFKTILDGTIMSIPDNILFYITSNRKNLIPIKFTDREYENETRISDTLEEKLSLVDRFGLRLGFYKLDKKTFLRIVYHYAERFKIKIDRKELELLAMRYAREMGILNGRVAYQFIKSLE